MDLEWIILTCGDRPAELARLLSSLAPCTDDVTVVLNTDEPRPEPADLPRAPRVNWSEPGRNLGIPAGRDHATQRSDADVFVFLDDDATLLTPTASQRIAQLFADDPQLGAVSFRLLDEHGATARRHVPRLGAADPTVAGPVAYFLGGACAIRSVAYRRAGGYWGELFYGHEELDLAWRLADAGYEIEYHPDICVEHPRTSIGRHPDGWFRTGRNRVMIARRNLPQPLALGHALMWAVLGAVRARRDRAVGPYLRGWLGGWPEPVVRNPIRWSTVWSIGRSGRFPIV